jgi:hypothetical protein
MVKLKMHIPWQLQAAVHRLFITLSGSKGPDKYKV